MIVLKQTFFVNDCKRFRATVTKNGGTAWTLTGMNLILISPTGTSNTYAMSSETGNVWYYDTANSELSSAGQWTALFRPTDGSFPNTYGKYSFSVQPVN